MIGIEWVVDATIACAQAAKKLVIPVLAAVTLSVSVASAEEPSYALDIPAQDLNSALKTLAVAIDRQVMFSAAAVEGYQSPAISGEFSTSEAMDVLLASSGLTYDVTVSNVLLVRAADSDRGGDSDSKNSGRALTLMAQNQTSFQATRGSQAPEASRGEAGAEEEVLEQIIVTGSRIRGAQSASPIVTIDRAEIDMAGFATVEEVVEYLPQNFGAGATSDATNGINQAQAVGGDVNDFSGGVSLNLRGLGASSTLVLLNGRRMSPSGNEAAFTNIASIPVTALERVEVMTDGASAIYGADAIGGVVNFILREDYEGAETRLRYGSDAGGDTSNVQFGQTLGTSWNDGNVLFSYEFFEREALAGADREFTASNDLSPFGGTDYRQPGGNPANIRTGPSSNRVWYAIPEGQDGTSLTSDDFTGSDSPQRFFNARTHIDVIPDVDRHSGFLHIQQTVGALHLFGAVRYTREESTRRQQVRTFDFTVLGDDTSTPDTIEGNPFFVDPTGTGLTTVRVDNYTLADDFGPSIVFGEIETAGAALGIRLDLSEEWQGEITVNWSQEEDQNSLGNQVDSSELRAAVNQTDPNLAFNPFGDGSNTNPAVIESLIQRKVPNGKSESELLSANLDISGDLFKISDRDVKLAAGMEFRDETLSAVRFIQTSNELTTDLSRDVFAAYAEFFVPLIGNTNRQIGAQRLEFSIAARYEDYSDFGSTTNPKLGTLWAPIETFILRATYGTSFRAPSLDSLDASRSSWSYFPDVFGLGGAFLVGRGRNAELDPEEATTWTAGFQWRPQWAENFSLDATYFNIDFSNRIERPVANFFTAVFNPDFASIVNLNPSDEEVLAIVNRPEYDPDSGVPFGRDPFPATDFGPGGVPVDAIFDNRLRNLAQSVVTGAEAQVSYSTDTALGSFTFSLNGSYMFDFERRFLPSAPLVDEVDTLGRPVDFRARANVTWNHESWTIAGFINYTDGYTDQFSDPERAVDSWTTLDLTVAYNTSEYAGLFSNTRVALTTQNLLDEDPPFVNTFGGVGFDATNASPLGRFFAFQVVKDW